jgi:hypothetical protein
VSIGTIGGLAAVIGAVLLFIAIHRKARSERDSGAGIDLVETMISFEGSDRREDQARWNADDGLDRSDPEME